MLVQKRYELAFTHFEKDRKYYSARVGVINGV